MKKNNKKSLPVKPHIPEQTLSRKEEFKHKDLRESPEALGHKAEEYRPKRVDKPE